MSYPSTLPLGSPSFDHPVYATHFHVPHVDMTATLIKYINRQSARYAELETNLNKKMGTHMTFLSDFVTDVKRMHEKGEFSTYIAEQENKKLLSYRNEYSSIFNSAWNDDVSTYGPNTRAALRGGDPFRAGPLKDLTFADWNECFNEVTTLTKILSGDCKVIC